MTDIFIVSAAVSNYEGMDALVGQDGRVYLGRQENYFPSVEDGVPSYYDNSDNSLQLVSGFSMNTVCCNIFAIALRMKRTWLKCWRRSTAAKKDGAQKPPQKNRPSGRADRRKLCRKSPCQM